MAYPSKPTGSNIVNESIIFAEDNPNNSPMTDSELSGGYNDDGEIETDLTSRPTSHKFNQFLFQLHNTIVWLIGMVEELKAEKMSASSGSSQPALNDLYMGGYKVRQLGDPIKEDDAVNKKYVDTKTANSMFLGEVKTLCYAYVPETTGGIEIVPCDGRALNKADYPELYQIIGGTFGSTNTTFNIPDYRGYFMRGWNGGSNRDIGRNIGSIQQSGVPNLTGRIGAVAEEGTNYATGMFYQNGTGGTGHGGGWDYFVFADASRVSSVYQNGLTECRPINQAVYYIMRIK